MPTISWAIKMIKIEQNMVQFQRNRKKEQYFFLFYHYTHFSARNSGNGDEEGYGSIPRESQQSLQVR